MDGSRAGDARDEGAAEQSLEIERENGFYAADRAKPVAQFEEIGRLDEVLARKVDDFVEVGIAGKERGPFGIDYPADFQARVCALEQVNRGERVDDVAEGTGLHHK